MLSSSEALLKARNYETAAQMAPASLRMIYLQQAAHWRQLAHELQMERFGPFGGGEGLFGDAVRDPTQPTAD